VRDDHVTPAPAYTLADGAEVQEVIQYSREDGEHFLPVPNSRVVLTWVNRRHNILNKNCDELQVIYNR